MAGKHRGPSIDTTRLKAAQARFTLTNATHAFIQRMAQQEQRSVANCVSVLIEEAVAARRKKNGQSTEAP